MSYIGKTPTSVPLTSSDITDGIISLPKLTDGTDGNLISYDASGNPVAVATGTDGQVLTSTGAGSPPAFENAAAGGDINFKNIIINGDMSLAQRATSVTGNTAGGYTTVDRWNTILTTAGTYTISQSTDVPSGQGFANSMKFDCTTADASLAAGDNMRLQSKFEGQNLQYLKKGTSNAESLTASFWVKSVKTGTYILELEDKDNSRTISKSYTISSANTWEKKTVTFPGDTTGAFGNDNARSLDVMFWLAAGSNFTSGTLDTSWGSTTTANRAVGQVNLSDSTSNDWYITGVQLEAGTAASDFEFLPFAANLTRCQRYFQKSYDVNVNPATSTSVGEQTIGGGSDSGGNISTMLTQHGEMRAAPTIVGYAGGTSGVWGVNRSGASGTGTFNSHRHGQHSTSGYANIGAGFTVGWITGHFTMSSEL